MKKIIELLKLDPKATEETVVAEIGKLQKTIADFEAAKRQQTADDHAIAEKMARGLTRNQAIAVIERQRAFDAAAAKAAKVKPSAK